MPEIQTHNLDSLEATLNHIRTLALQAVEQKDPQEAESTLARISAITTDAVKKIELLSHSNLTDRFMQKIQETELSPRMYRAIFYDNIDFWGSILFLSQTEVLRMPNIGEISVEELSKTLKEKTGYHLAEFISHIPQEVFSLLLTTFGIHQEGTIADLFSNRCKNRDKIIRDPQFLQRFFETLT